MSGKNIATKSNCSSQTWSCPQGISGRDLAAKLLFEKPALKVIYSSGYSLAVVGTDMVLQEGLNFLQKPYHPRKLAQTIRDCLDA